MKNKLLPLFFVLASYSAYSQVGIGTTMPNPSSQLEVVANDKGVLIPRVQLKSLTDAATITNGNVNSLLVFNTGTAADIKPGYYYWYDNRWNRIVIAGEIESNKGTVIYNAVTKEFVFVDDSGNNQPLDLKNFETITTLKKDAANDGKYVYTNEGKAETTIDVVADVINNAHTIIKNEKFVTELTQFVDSKETVTTLEKNAANDGKYLYTNEDKAETTIDVVADVINNAGAIISNEKFVTELTNVVGSKETLTSLIYDAAGKTLSYQAEKGAPNVINLVDLVGDAETITEIVNKGKGVYTYKNETTAEPVTINVVGDVADNFQTIINNPEVTNVLNTFITKSEGTVSFNSTTNEFTYTDASGATQTVNINEIVKGNETLTSLTYDAAGKTLSYQAEKGAPNVIKLVDLVGAAQTLTSLAVNGTTGTLDYKDENNFVTSVNLSAAVKEPWFSSTTKAGATTNTENIYTQGWVGIGFDTPSGKAGEKLRINGSITTVNSTYADYVFEDYFQGYSDIKADYKFKGLAEIEQYIKTHKHLPGITPINELERTSEGYSFNMSELSIQLLEKTEEIYLHIIEQNNAIIAKDKEIAKMNERLERLEKLIEENTTSSNQAPVSSN